MEALGSLACGVAHDFNNLLTIINGYAGLCRKATGEDPELIEGLEAVLDAGHRAEGLTRQLLAFSRKQITEPQTLNMIDLLEDLKKILTRLLGEDIELLMDLDRRAPTLFADPTQLEQIVMNLVINARDAIREGNRSAPRQIRITCGPTRLSNGGNGIELKVEDNGCGIADLDQQRIFEPFFTTKEAGKGTGLGLSTVWSIVEQNKAQISIESEVGRGSCFKVFWPAGNRQGEPLAAAAPPPEKGNHEHILVVDDDPGIRMLTMKALELLDYQPHCFESAEMAIKHLDTDEAEMPQLVISDVVLPGMNGVDFCKKMQQQAPDLPVLLITGYQGEADSTKLEALPKSQLLLKPFSLTALQEKVAQLLV